MLPDGSIAKVSVDFDTLLKLSRIARKEYGMGGAVQHGASTLPEDAFGKFVEAEAVEVHLATNFQNMLFDRLPADLRAEMYAYLDVKSAAERKPDMTDEQFYYKTRKNAVGPFKKQTWNMPAGEKGRDRPGLGRTVQEAVQIARASRHAQVRRADHQTGGGQARPAVLPGSCSRRRRCLRPGRLAAIRPGWPIRATAGWMMPKY